MHRGAAACHSVETYCFVELGQFGLEVLVDAQKGFECAADVAIATRYDLIDGGFACVGNHGYSSEGTLEQLVVGAHVPVDVGQMQAPATSPSGTSTDGESVDANL